MEMEAAKEAAKAGLVRILEEIKEPKVPEFLENKNQVKIEPKIEPKKEIDSKE